jgi:hypothetical protein
MHTWNTALTVGGALSCLAALLHIAVIVGGADWYRFFGAGERMAAQAAAGSAIPGLITLGIAVILAAWGLYGFAGAGLIGPLPFMRAALIAISAVYLARALVIIPVYFKAPEKIDAFAVWSSLICLVYGVFYTLGIWQRWQQLA